MLSFNILPPEAQQEFRVQKQIRIALIWGGSFFLVLAAFMLLLLPSYFISSFQKEEVFRNLSLTQENPLVKRVIDIRQSVATLKENAADIERTSKSSGFFSSIVKDVVSAFPLGITPTALQFDASQKKVVIMGFADKRNALIALEAELKRNSKISNVIIPLSDLVRDQNVPFSITFTIEP